MGDQAFFVFQKLSTHISKVPSKINFNKFNKYIFRNNSLGIIILVFQIVILGFFFVYSIKWKLFVI